VQDGEAFGGVRPLYDFDVDLAEHVAQRALELRPLIPTVGIELEQEWIHAEQRGHDQHAAISVLDVCRMHNGVQQQALGVYKEMALLAFDLLASVEAGGIDPRPPFSALLTLWLSMMAAVGLASRSACSRHLT
jgi:hypothetical protein